MAVDKSVTHVIFDLDGLLLGTSYAQRCSTTCSRLAMLW